MLQIASVTAFTISELLRENQQEGKITPPPPSPPRLGLRYLRTRYKCAHRTYTQYMLT